MNPNRREKPKPPMIRKKISLIFYMTFWVLILIMFSGLIIVQASRYNELQADLSRINADIAYEYAIYRDLYNQLMFFDSDAYIEMRARERFGMVRQDEMVFRNIAE